MHADERAATTSPSAAPGAKSCPSDRVPKIANARRRELRLSDSVSSGSRDKSARFDAEPARDQARKRTEQGRCARPAKGIRWLMPDGTLEPVRCGASNRCDYCAMF